MMSGDVEAGFFIGLGLQQVAWGSLLHIIICFLIRKHHTYLDKQYLLFHFTKQALIYEPS